MRNFSLNNDDMGSEGDLYSSKSTNGGKGLKNSKINSYFTQNQNLLPPYFLKQLNLTNRLKMRFFKMEK